MKTLPLLATVAALAAFALVPFVLEVAATAIFVGGFIALLVSDYTSGSRRLRLDATVTAPAVATAGTRSERFGLAA